MARTMRGYLAVWLQQETTEEPETNSSVSHQEEEDATQGNVVADCEPDVDYKQEGSDPEIKPIN